MQDVKYYNGKLYIQTDDIWDEEATYWQPYTGLIVEYNESYFNECEVENLVLKVLHETYYDHSMIKSLPDAIYWRPIEIKELL